MNCYSKENNIEVHSYAKSVAASGGYFLLSSGSKIYARKDSLIGSIGVISTQTNFHSILKSLYLDNKVFITSYIEKKLNFTELDRLSFIIRIIDYETSIFPQGAFKLIPIHELRRNENFKGLKKEELKDITKYSHFRKPSQLDKIMNIEKEEAIFRTDILDDLNKDSFKSKCIFLIIIILDTWTFQLDSTKSIVNIRSILWPGYFAYHKAETNMYGCVYIGTGVKNAELPFMI